MALPRALTGKVVCDRDVGRGMRKDRQHHHERDQMEHHVAAGRVAVQHDQPDRNRGERSYGEVGKQHHHNRQRQAVVEPGLNVEQMPQPARHLLTAHDRGRKHRIGGREDRGDDNASGHGSPASVTPSPAVTRNVSGIPSSNARPGSRQAAAKSAKPDPLPIGEQHREQCKLSEHRDQLVLGAELHHPDHPVAKQEPSQQNSTAVDSTLRCASPESNTPMSRTTEKARSSATPPVFPEPLAHAMIVHSAQRRSGKGH